MKELLFVYGSLRSQVVVPKQIAGIVKSFARLGSAQVRGKLYDFGDYCGAVLDNNSRTLIQGELVELPSDDNVLAELDEYEGIDWVNPKKSLFLRRRTAIKLADGSIREGWIYVYNKRPGKAPLIRGGDYLRFKGA